MRVERSCSKRLFGASGGGGGDGSTTDVKDLGLFFFAGHGIQASGKNLLIPTDFVAPEPMGSDPSSLAAMETMVRKRTVELDEIMSNMSDARLFCAVVLLDCCRTRPQFMRSLSRGESRGGLANVSAHSMQADGGTLIAFATGPDRVAKDSSTRIPGHSPFTAALITRLATEADAPLHNLFMRITSDVLADTGDEQEPWVQSSLRATAEGMRFSSKQQRAAAPAENAAPQAASPAGALTAEQPSLTELLAKWKLEEYAEQLQMLGVSEAEDLAEVMADAEMMSQVPFRPLHLKKFKQLAEQMSSLPAPAAAASAAAPVAAAPLVDSSELAALRVEVARLRKEVGEAHSNSRESAGAARLALSVGWQSESVVRTRISVTIQPLSARGFAAEKAREHMGEDVVVILGCTLGLATGTTLVEAEELLALLERFVDSLLTCLFTETPSIAESTPTVEMHLVMSAETEGEERPVAIAMLLRLSGEDCKKGLAPPSALQMYMTQLGCSQFPSGDLSVELGCTVPSLMALGAAPLMPALTGRLQLGVWPARWLSVLFLLDNPPVKGLQGDLPPFIKVLVLLSSFGISASLESLGDWRLHSVLGDEERQTLASLTGFDLRQAMAKLDADPVDALELSREKDEIEGLEECVRALVGADSKVTGIISAQFTFPSGRIVLEQATVAATGGEEPPPVPISLRDMATVLIMLDDKGNQ
jgi:uncharacterized caspase-like protein